mmetsp:Transcript_7820/g.24473  ORF Transcript_7820/g.24473 Transcript_7820/m.24473 type:complete len:331 (+) Transcript_7820:723-1715(+)
MDAPTDAGGPGRRVAPRRAGTRRRARGAADGGLAHRGRRAAGQGYYNRPRRRRLRPLPDALPAARQPARGAAAMRGAARRSCSAGRIGRCAGGREREHAVESGARRGAAPARPRGRQSLAGLPPQRDVRAVHHRDAHCRRGPRRDQQPRADPHGARRRRPQRGHLRLSHFDGQRRRPARRRRCRRPSGASPAAVAHVRARARGGAHARRPPHAPDPGRQRGAVRAVPPRRRRVRRHVRRHPAHPRRDLRHVPARGHLCARLHGLCARLASLRLGARRARVRGRKGRRRHQRRRALRRHAVLSRHVRRLRRRVSRGDAARPRPRLARKSSC